MSQRIVEIRRRPYTRDPKFGKPIDLVANEKHNIGGSMKGAVANRGLTVKEEQFLMPEIIGLLPEDSGFKKAVNEWFSDMQEFVPHSGLRLNVSLTNNEYPVFEKLPDSTINYPLETRDYILWRYCLAYPDVVKTKEDLDGDINARFYIHCVEDETNKVNDLVKSKMKAVQHFSKNMDNERVINAIIRTLTGVSREGKTSLINVREPEKLSLTVKQNMLDGIIQGHSDIYLQVAADINLEKRAEIYEMIDRGVIEFTGSKYIFMSEELGKSVEHILAFVNAAQNSGQYVMMKGRLEAFGDRETARQEAVVAPPSISAPTTESSEKKTKE